jgi:hypothetical protein
MKILFIFLLLVSPVAAQTRAELDGKYGPSENNRYRVKPGISMDVTFSESGKAKQIRIVPDDSKDTNAFLRDDDILSVIKEILPGRMRVGASESVKQIDMPCPPLKGCKGYQEVFKTLTVLTVRYERSIVYAVLTPDDKSFPPPGNMTLLPGYEHMPHYGIDTQVGVIKKIGGMTIDYDIGFLAGNFAVRYVGSAEWVRTEQAGNDSVLIVLTKDKRIIATFEKAVANFHARVGSQSDIDDFLKMVLTYDPSKRIERTTSMLTSMA